MTLGTLGSLMLLATSSLGPIDDNFEGYAIGSPPAGDWVDASSWVTNPTNPGPTAMIISTPDPAGNTTQAMQIQNGIGSSGGIIGSVNYASVQRFETDLRLDQQGNGSAPNWIAAAGFLQETKQNDFNWMPQAFVYAMGTSRTFRLYVRNADGQNGAARDFGLGAHTWQFGVWYRISIEVDTSTGVFDTSIVNLETGAVLSNVTNTYARWNTAFGQYDAISVNDGEYGTNPGTIGNMATIDNISHVEVTNCYADCDQSTGNGVLDIFDFLCFQNAFVAGDEYACDCDTSTGLLTCDIFDFLCFQNAFVAGCP